MKSKSLNLKNIINLDKWQKLQDSLATVTKMAIITVDYKGIPVSKHSNCNPFCTAVRKNPNLLPYCQKCDSRGGLEAVRLNKAYIYLCHYNIVDIAIPIIVDDKYIGAIMAGQIKLINKDNESSLEQILNIPSKCISVENSKELKEYYSKIPSLSYSEVENIAAMLLQLCNYIVEEALNKNLVVEMYGQEFQSKKSLEISSTLSTYKTENIENFKKELSNALINTQIKEFPTKKEISSNSILKPAFSYIFEHKSENVSLKKLSDLCHISSSYFSRIFRKEMGQTYSTYITLLKIEWAKQLLESTDITVSQISYDLGFSESGYFIKIFKKHEGVTPFLYRKYFKDTSIVEPNY